MTQTIKPAATQLFCKPKEAEAITKSGIFIGDAAEKPQMAEVINVGSAVKEFAARETVIYKPYATVEIKLDRVDYFLVDQEDVLGTVVEVA